MDTNIRSFSQGLKSILEAVSKTSSRRHLLGLHHQFGQWQQSVYEWLTSRLEESYSSPSILELSDKEKVYYFAAVHGLDVVEDDNRAALLWEGQVVGINVESFAAEPALSAILQQHTNSPALESRTFRTKSSDFVITCPQLSITNPTSPDSWRQLRELLDGLPSTFVVVSNTPTNPSPDFSPQLLVASRSVHHTVVGWELSLALENVGFHYPDSTHVWALIALDNDISQLGWYLLPREFVLPWNEILRCVDTPSQDEVLEILRSYQARFGELVYGYQPTTRTHWANFLNLDEWVTDVSLENCLARLLLRVVDPLLQEASDRDKP